MKVAILLYGMFRDANVPFFWDCMLPKAEIFIFATFIKIPLTTRSFDKEVVSNVTFPGISRATAWSIVDQKEFDKAIELEHLILNKKSLFEKHQKETVKNAVRVIFQLSKLKQLFLAHKADHTHAILSRVDIVFVRPVNTMLFQRKTVVPNYASFSGLNDRFTAGPIHEILSLMNRFEVWNRTGALAEALMSKTFQFYGVKPQLINIGYNRRIRVGGLLHQAQYKINQNCILDTSTNLQQILSSLHDCGRKSC